MISPSLQPSALKLLLLSTPVGPLGSGLGGGVELTLKNIALELLNRGHRVTVIAPEGSTVPPIPLMGVEGALQPLAQSQARSTPITLPPDSVLARMWSLARQQQAAYDLIVNFAYDWLPFYLTPFFQRPIAHLVSMGSLSDAMDHAIAQVAQHFPGTIGVHTWAQAQTFPFAAQCHALGNGLDLSLYHFRPEPESTTLAWVGRIAPEKGLEDAIAAIQISQTPLKIWGTISDDGYWQHIRQTYPHAPYSYEGFLSTEELQAGLGRCRALVMTPKWVEAFGNVAIEALACGVPVITYRRGGPVEIVQDGETGYVVEPDDINGLVYAIARLEKIERSTCRRVAEANYSMQAMGDRVEAWFRRILATGTAESSERYQPELGETDG